MNNSLLIIFLLLLFGASAHGQTVADEHEHEHEHEDHHTHDQHEPAEHQEEHDHSEDEHAHEDMHHDEGHTEAEDHSEHEHDHGEESHQDVHAHSDDHEEHDHGAEPHQEGVTKISADMADQADILTAQATSKILRQNIRLYGSLVTGSEQLSHVRARYEGLIQSVNVSIGDEVQAGDLLAEVESNDSLKTYQIRAPISGQITQRHANTGEFAQDQVLFSITNFDSLWAELHVFSTHSSDVESGQAVSFVGIEGAEAINPTINHIVPAPNSPNQIARVKVDNRELRLSLGQMLEAQVRIGSFIAALAVELRAIQSLDGREGVFVREGDEYIFTPLVLGRRDASYVEVLEGLEPMAEYVTENSYLIKADIEKSEAEHVH